MAVKPIVDRLESQVEGRLTVIRLNVQDPAGRILAEGYDVRYTPTFVFLDAQGNRVWRTVGAIDPAEVERALEGP